MAILNGGLWSNKPRMPSPPSRRRHRHTPQVDRLDERILLSLPGMATAGLDPRPAGPSVPSQVAGADRPIGLDRARFLREMKRLAAERRHEAALAAHLREAAHPQVAIYRPKGPRHPTRPYHPIRPKGPHHPRRLHGGTPAPTPTPAPPPSSPFLPISFPPSTPTSTPPYLSVSPTSLSFNATISNTLDPPAQFFDVYNLGGGTLNVTEKAQQPWMTLYNAGPAAGGGDAIGVQIQGIGNMSPGTYYGSISVSAPGATDGTQTVYVTLNLTPPAFTGLFQGYVMNDPKQDGYNDPGASFSDPYVGTISMTLTGGPGDYTLAFQGTITNADADQEDFTTYWDGFSVTVANLGNIQFKIPMGDGEMAVHGALSGGLTGGTFFGTWQFQRLNPNDSSDSGQGNFSLST